MPKINKLEIYNLRVPNRFDFVPGTKTDDNGKTVSFLIDDIANINTNNLSQNQILFIADINLNNQTLTVQNSDEVVSLWRISGLFYQSSVPFVTTIPFAQNNRYRTDLLVATNDENEPFVYILGQEDLVFSPEPIPDFNTQIKVFSINVFGNTIQMVPEPESGFVTKASYAIQPTGVDTDGVIAIDSETRSFDILKTSNNLLRGFTVTQNEDFPAYNGMPIFVRNGTGVNITIQHNFNQNNIIKIFFQNQQNYTLLPNETVMFLLGKNGARHIGRVQNGGGGNLDIDQVLQNGSVATDKDLVFEKIEFGGKTVVTISSTGVIRIQEFTNEPDFDVINQEILINQAGYNVIYENFGSLYMGSTVIDTIQRLGFFGSLNSKGINLSFQEPASLTHAIVPDSGGSAKRLAYEDYVDAEIQANINVNFLGTYTSKFALQTAHPTAQSGNYAIVDTVGVDAVKYIWDATDNDWVASSSVGPTTTDSLTEGTNNLYHTSARVRATSLSGLSLSDLSQIISTDSVLVALGKLQAQSNVKSNIPTVVVNNINAVNNQAYTNNANSIYTDPSPVSGNGYTVFVRSGTATIGGVNYNQGRLVYRFFNGSSWATHVFLNENIIGSAVQAALDLKPNNDTFAQTMSINAAVNASTTTFNYIAGGGTFNNTEINRQLGMPYPLRLQGFAVTTANNQSGSGNLTVAVRKGGATVSGTSRVINANAPAGIYSVLFDELIETTDLINFIFINAATTGSANIIGITWFAIRV